MTLTLERSQVVTILTLFIVLLWMVTTTVRLFHPLPAATILDAAMAPVLGYWFVSKGGDKE